MNKIKHCWIKTLRKTVLVLLQINVNFVLISIKFIPDSFFRSQSLKSKKIWNRCFWNSRFTRKNVFFNECCALSFLERKKFSVTISIRNSIYYVNVRPLYVAIIEFKWNYRYTKVEKILQICNIITIAIATKHRNNCLHL